MWRAIFLTFGGLYALTARASPPADLVFLNGAVYEVDAARAWASAVVVTNGRISYVGDNATAQTFIGNATQVVDLRGRMLLPGFQDSHMHPSEYVGAANRLDLHGLARRDQIFARIQQYSHEHPKSPWIVGAGWDESAFSSYANPSRQMLDVLIRDRPVLLYAHSGHQAWANSRALALSHITRKTRDPLNGHIERDSWGQPTGVLHEDAMDLVWNAIPPPSLEEQTTNLSAALREMSQYGITSFVDALVTPGVARAYHALDQQDKLPLRANLCLLYEPSKNDDTQIHQFESQRSALEGRHVRASCVKIFLDGSYGPHTVALLQPYSDDPKFGRGKLFVEQERLNRLISRLDALGFQVHIHAQGDWAVHAALDAIANSHSKNGYLDNRHTIAHLCLVDPEDITRFRMLGVIANMTPLWSVGDYWEKVLAPRLFGEERSQHIFETRKLLEAGAILVWGSDWPPITGVSPLEGIETAITHRFPGGRDPAGHEDQAWFPQQSVSLEQAIVAYTSAGAYLTHDEATRGSVSAGKVADLVVLSGNLFEKSPLEIHTVQVDMTLVEGNVVFARTGSGISVGPRENSRLPPRDEVTSPGAAT